MKGKKYIAVVLALLLVLLFTSTVSAKNETIEFTYTEVCDNDQHDRRSVDLQWAGELVNERFSRHLH